MFTVVDTPGFGDSDGEDEQNIEEMMTVLDEHIRSADGIMLLFKGDMDRFQDGLVAMVKQMTILFGEDMWKHTIIGVSYWHYDQESIDDREEYCGEGYPPELCHNEEWFLKEVVNSQLREKLHLNITLPGVFIDAKAKFPHELDDELQQEYFNRETTKLLEFLQSGEEFSFRTINDVIEENTELKVENKRLQDIIDDSLNQLFEKMEVVEQNIEHNSDEISNLEADGKDL